MSDDHFGTREEMIERYHAAKAAGYILAMHVLQSEDWKNLDDETRAAAEGFLPQSLRAYPQSK